MKITPVFILILVSILSFSHSFAVEPGVVQGELVPVSQVRFEVIDGFAFQNFIKVYVNGLHIGNYIGPMGTKTVEFRKKVESLQNMALVQGGAYYLPKKTKPIRGENVIEKIVHFPEAKRSFASGNDLASCEKQLLELENRASLIYRESLKVSRPLEQLLQQMQSRQPLGESKNKNELSQPQFKRSPSQDER